MNKKGMSESTIVILAFGLFAFVIVLASTAYMTGIASSVANSAAIQNWVLLKSSKLGTVQGGSSPPVPMLKTEPIKIISDEQLKNNDANRLIAESMVDCWKAFDSGETDFMPNLKVPERDELIDPFCFPCARIEFDEKLKDGRQELIGFQNFLQNEKPLPGADSPTYANILTNLVYFPSQEAKQTQKYIIPKNNDYYIFFISTKKENFYDFLRNNFDDSLIYEVAAAAGSGAVIAGTACTFVFPVVGTVACAVGGAAVGVISAYTISFLYKGEEVFRPAIVLGTPQEINKICNPDLLNQCEECGLGRINACDQKECQNLADQLGISCWYDDAYTVNSCYNEQKPNTIELKSANPINTSNNLVTAPTQPITQVTPSNVDAQNLAKLMESLQTKSIEGRTCKCENNCQQYANWIVDYTNKQGLPDSLLTLSIMMQESNCRQSAFSSSGCVGLMQICDWNICINELSINSKNDLKGQQNAEKNVACGAIILRNKYNTYKSKSANYDPENCGYNYDDAWQRAIRGYVGWGCKHKTYVEEVMPRYNQLKEEYKKTQLLV